MYSSASISGNGADGGPDRPSPATAPAHRIVIFQDTLERNFGSDPDLLARQVERTLRPEVAHHLGDNEPGVAALGL